MNNLSNEELVNKFNSMRGLYMVYGKFQNERDFEQAEAISKELFAIIAAGEEAVKKVSKLEDEVENLRWWREYGQRLRNAVSENLTYAYSDDELVNAPKEARLKIIELEKEVERLKCCGNCKYFMYCKTDGLIYCEIEVFPFPIKGMCNQWQSDGLTKEERIKG